MFMYLKINENPMDLLFEYYILVYFIVTEQQVRFHKLDLLYLNLD